MTRPLDPSAATPGQPRQRLATHYSRWFARFFSRTSDAVFVTGPDFRVLWWSPRAEEMLGVPASRAAGRRCYEVIAGRHEAGQAECGPGCWVMRAARHGTAVPAFHLDAQGGGEARGSYTVGIMSDEAGTLLVHVLRPIELPAPRPVVSPGEPGPQEASAHDSLRWLTSRERQVLLLIRCGATSKEIAGRLSISRATARNHVQNVLVKLGVHSRLEAALVAVSAGLELPGLHALEAH